MGVSAHGRSSSPSLLARLTAPWPWAPFLLSALARLFPAACVVLVIEGAIFGVIPSEVRKIGFIFTGVSIGLLFMRVALSMPDGTMPDLAIKTEMGMFRSETVAWVASGMRGWRSHMEDAHVAEMLDPSVFPDSALFAVLDGHGGKEVSALAAHLLGKELTSVGRELLEQDGNGSSTTMVEKALERTLPQLDSKFRKGAMGLGMAFPRAWHPFSTVGSTACVAVVDFTAREVVVANIGDSRTLLIRNGKAIPLSEDHKPENPKETTRIQNAGGKVVKAGPCYRVDGNLNLSRAFGDFFLKANSTLPDDKQKVSAYPDIKKEQFLGGQEDCLVVACDGLFERCTNQDIADLVWPRLQAGKALKQISEEVLRACCARGVRGRPVEAGTDNETMVIVKLPPMPSNNQDDALCAGERVVVHGLETESGRLLNGEAGVIEGPSDVAGRVNVRLSSTFEVKSLKEDNLKRAPVN
eukprot:TRINITY_DN1551_c0_g3_i1.p1 TRINITY_DN1551_c0_g3~~TRINITY_DN1551_c0_g3_i1.p1  ORF type:complete len:468 (-),score=76.58 TRINITY_DN1551_c0_g3_i1:44-1447(-)